MIYVLLVLSPIFILAFYQKTEMNNSYKKWYLTFCGIPIFLVTALRHNTIGGDDPQQYYEHYLFSQSMSFKQFCEFSRMEDGYDIVIKILASVFHNPQFVFVFSGLFFTIVICRYIYLNSSSPMISLIIYITLGSFTFSLMGLRQTIAMSICLLSIEYIKKKKLFMFVLLIIIAMQFHITAIIFLPVYFISKITISAKNALLFLIVSSVTILSANSIVGMANKVFSSNYINTVNSGGIVVVLTYLITIFATFLYRKSVLKNKDSALFFNMVLLGFISYILRYFGALASERISFYFFYAIIILLPETINSLGDEKERKLARYTTVTLAISLFLYRVYKTPILMPYKFFWQ